MSIIWPPTMPRVPAAAPSASTSSQRACGIGMGVGFGQHLEGAGLQRVAGQDGGGFVEGLVAARLAAAQVVVVHGRQVVVHQRIGVQHFDGGGDAGGAGAATENMLATSMTRKARMRLPPSSMA